jgi:redox-sensitive bicupin YhaK (pirin superfamily)
VSNLERDPVELVADGGAVTTADAVEILEPRDVPLGGPRAMPVRRTLPQRSRSLIGAWCFLDHYGPDLVSGSGGMVVPPHPHTGLQTVSWLFAGEIEHRDSVGSRAPVRPGELNLMTAASGISHSEVSTPATTTLHGAQLWVALPESARNGAPAFESYVPQPFAVGPATLRVFIGELAGVASPATVFTRMLGAQVDLPSGSSVTLDVDPRFEHGVLVDAGEASVDGIAVPVSHLAYVPVGSSTLTLATGERDARLLLLGGEPLGERIVMWWNFIGRTHDEIVEYRDAWQREVIAGENGHGRFGTVEYDGRPLPAPELPVNVRLSPRG